MNRNGLYLIVGALAVAVVVLGVWLYREKESGPGVSVEIGEEGISVDTN